LYFGFDVELVLNKALLVAEDHKVSPFEKFINLGLALALHFTFGLVALFKGDHHVASARSVIITL